MASQSKAAEMRGGVLPQEPSTFVTMKELLELQF